ncbi:MAG: MBL fold metallo-hydrolase [Promethearchaeota archaeon]
MENDKAVEVNDGIYWVGFGDDKAGFSNNPYLLVEGDSVVLFDPGSRLPEHFNTVKKKIESVVPVEKINAIIVHHQDPDLCASIPLFEEIIGVDEFELISTWRTSLLLPYYGIRTEITPIEDGESIELDNGRELVFVTAPYLHFAGSHVTYDTKTKTLFSGDIFGGFTANWKLYADEYYVESMKAFIEPYIAHNDVVANFLKKVADLGIEIDMICPQHGSVIKKELVPMMVDAISKFEVGSWLI